MSQQCVIYITQNYSEYRVTLDTLYFQIYLTFGICYVNVGFLMATSEYYSTSIKQYLYQCHYLNFTIKICLYVNDILLMHRYILYIYNTKIVKQKKQ